MNLIKRDKLRYCSNFKAHVSGDRHKLQYTSFFFRSCKSLFVDFDEIHTRKQNWRNEKKTPWIKGVYFWINCPVYYFKYTFMYIGAPLSALFIFLLFTDCRWRRIPRRGQFTVWCKHCVQEFFLWSEEGQNYLSMYYLIIQKQCSSSFHFTPPVIL